MEVRNIYTAIRSVEQSSRDTNHVRRVMLILYTSKSKHTLFLNGSQYVLLWTDTTSKYGEYIYSITKCVHFGVHYITHMLYRLSLSVQNYILDGRNSIDCNDSTFCWVRWACLHAPHMGHVDMQLKLCGTPCESQLWKYRRQSGRHNVNTSNDYFCAYQLVLYWNFS